jgi:hypothetical protein
MKTFKQLREEFDVCPVCKRDPCACEDSHGFVKEDGMGGGAAVPGPSNVVSSGGIAGTGGKGGEPGVYPKKKRKVVIQPMGRRSPPKM